jgi:flavodoxin
MKAIVLYYSVSSHTESVAAQIAKRLGCDFERILTVDAYGDDIIDKSRKEADNGILPAIRPLTHDLSNYDTIFLGTPVWWKSAAMPVLTLISTGKLTGHTIYPFITTGFDVTGVESKLSLLLMGNIVKPALIVAYENAIRVTEDDKIDKWVDKALND